MTSTSHLDSGGRGFNVDGSVVRTQDGSVYDLSTADGVAEVQGALSLSELDELDELMKAQGFALIESRWVPNDAMVSASQESELAETRRTVGGVGDVADGATELDRDLNENVYKPAATPSPYHGQRIPELDRNTHDSALRTKAGEILRDLAADLVHGIDGFDSRVLTSTRGRDGVRAFSAAMKEFETESSQGNMMELLYLVFRDSITQTNEDKKYFLTKLQDYNAIAESLSGYLSELVRSSEELSTKSIGNDEPDKVNTIVTVKSFDTSTVDASGQGVLREETTKPLTRSGLNDTIKDVEAMQETVRNKRQMTSTAFQNFDQKSNQLYSLMSSVLRVMREMQSGTTRNML